MKSKIFTQKSKFLFYLEIKIQPIFSVKITETNSRLIKINTCTNETQTFSFVPSGPLKGENGKLTL